MKKAIHRRDLLLNYYGKPKPLLTATQSIVLAQQFDDGAPLTLSWQVSAFEEPMRYGAQMTDEFTAAMSDDYSFVDEMSYGGRDFSEDLGEDYYVESFEETSVQHSKPNIEKPCGCHDKKETLGDTRQAEVPVPSPDLYHQPTKLPATAKGLTDDDLMADIQSILSGQKQYDSEQKQMVASPAYQASNQRPTPQDETRPLDLKGSHQIFEQLAQSMRYANAYDLGAISLSNRFDTFDKEADSADRKKDSVYDVQYYEPEAPKQMSQPPNSVPYEKASMMDFVEDLDIIKSSQLSPAQATPINWTNIRDEIVKIANRESNKWCKHKDVNNNHICESGHMEKYKEEDDNVETHIMAYWGILGKSKDGLIRDMLEDLKKPENDRDKIKDNCSESRFNDAVTKYGSKEFGTLVAAEKTELFNLALCHFPWSAAFVSYIIKEALKAHGQGSIFSVRAAHNKYLVDAMNNRTNGKPIHAFKADLVDLEPGDIIINNRKATAISDDWYKEVDGIVKFDTSKVSGKYLHGDIVLSVDTANHKVKVIGGNTHDAAAGHANTVGVKEIALQTNNRLVYSTVKDAGHFAVVKMIS